MELRIFSKWHVFWFALLVSNVQIANAEYYIHNSLYCVDAVSFPYITSIYFSYDRPAAYFQWTTSGLLAMNPLDGTELGESVRSIGYTANKSPYADCIDVGYYNRFEVVASEYVFNADDWIIAEEEDDPNDDFSQSECEQLSQDGFSLSLISGTSCFMGCSVTQNSGHDYLLDYDYQKSTFSGSTCTSLPDLEGIPDNLVNGNCVESSSLVFGELTTNYLCPVNPSIDSNDLGLDPLPDDSECLISYDSLGIAVGSVCNSNESDDSACWYENNQFYCTGSDYENGYSCTSINGNIACSYSDGSEIDPDSPDNPANGGNGDGDSSNDIFNDSGDGTIDTGGYGHGGTATYDQSSLSTSDVLSADLIGSSVDESLTDNFDEVNDHLSNIETNTDAMVDFITMNGDETNDYYMEACIDTECAELITKNISTYIQESQTMQTLMAVQDVIGSASTTCPDFSIDLSGVGWGTIGTDIHCVIYDEIGSTLSACFLLGWILLGVRIFMSA